MLFIFQRSFLRPFCHVSSSEVVFVAPDSDRFSSKRRFFVDQSKTPCSLPQTDVDYESREAGEVPEAQKEDESHRHNSRSVLYKKVFLIEYLV